MTDFREALEEREALNQRLYAALKHLSMEQALFIVASHIPSHELKSLVLFQESKT